ncbi:MAG: hypothetical protein QM638_13790 [Nocardioides sp.]
MFTRTKLAAAAIFATFAALAGVGAVVAAPQTAVTAEHQWCC